MNSTQTIRTLETENANLRGELLKYKLKYKETAPEVDYELLSDRCRNLLEYVESGDWLTRSKIADALDMTHSQITSTMELLRKKGFQFDTREIRGKHFLEYRYTTSAAQPSRQLFTRSLKASNERLVIEMNRIRNTASDGVNREIERMATQALNAAGLLVAD